MNSYKLKCKPPTITKAIILLYIGLVFSIINMGIFISQSPQLAREINVVGLMFSALVAFIFNIWIIDKTSDGSNWARIILLVYSLCAFLNYLLKINIIISAPLLLSIFSAISWVLQFTALYMIFLSSGANYYKKA